MKTTLLFAFLLLVSTSAWAMDPIVREDGSVVLSKPIAQPIENSTMMVSGASSTLYKQFAQKFGECSVMVDKNTGNAKAILCSPISISSESAEIDEIRSAADRFLTDNQDALRIDFKGLRFATADKRNGIWYVFYKQYLDGSEIESSHITLHIQNGKTGFITMNYYPKATLSAPQGLANGSRPDYEKAAAYGIKYPTERIQMIQSNFKTKVIAIESEAGITFRKVFAIPFKIKNSVQAYTSYVAVDNGDLLSRRSELQSERTVNVSGTVRMVNATNPEVTVPFQDIGFTSTGAPVYTNLQGNATLPSSYSGQMRYMMNGLKTSIYVMTSESESDTPMATVAVQNDGNQNITINSDVADLGTRTVFYHANFFKDFIKAMDPAIPGMDYAMPIEIQYYYDYSIGPNAYYSRIDDKIAFTCVSENRWAFVECPDVLYHEYGHAVNTYIYKVVYDDGLTNATVNESFADLMAVSITDNSILGMGHDRENPSDNIRNCKNTRKYPQDMSEESHNDSMILTGAFWDLREMKDLEYFKKITHQVRYARVDGIDAGTCFLRIFLETLYADDNDGNLLNGTPNMPLIVKAFNNHNIGTSLFVSSNIAHTKLPATADTLNPYNAKLSINFSNFIKIPVEIGNVDLLYYTNWNKAVNRITATKNSSEYSALIPAQRPGTLVYYWFEIQTSVDTIVRYEYMESSKPYSFMVGYERVFEESMNMSQWTLGLPYDYQANSVSWEYAVPKPVLFTANGTEFNLQPRGGVGGSTTKCLVTGASDAGGPMDVQSLPAGTLTAESPEYDLSTYKHPVFSFDYWFKAKRFYPDLYSSQQPEFTVSASYDGGYYWSEIHKAYRDTTTAWNNMLIDLTNAGQSVKFRFKLRSGGMYFMDSELYLIFVLTKCLVDKIEIYDSKAEYNPAEGELAVRSVATVAPQPAENDVRFSFAAKSSYRLRISNLFGQQVFSVENAAIGTNQQENFVWDRTCTDGSQAQAGIYFYEIVTGKDCIKGKFALSGK